MENKASYEKKVCGVKRFIKSFYIRLFIQNVIFHKKNSFLLTLFKLKLNSLKMQASDLRGLLVCYYWCSILAENDENSLLSICFLLNPNVPGLLGNSELLMTLSCRNCKFKGKSPHIPSVSSVLG